LALFAVIFQQGDHQRLSYRTWGKINTPELRAAIAAAFDLVVRIYIGGDLMKSFFQEASPPAHSFPAVDTVSGLLKSSDAISFY
jgi:hypothetical protein